MPSGPRIRANNVFGLTTDNPLSSGATTFNSASLFLLPVVSSAHAVVVLDPKRVNGEPEIVIVTAHTALATSATITRAAYGTTARAHPMGTQWAHVVVSDDAIPVVTSGTRPSDPFEGQTIYETDTDFYKGYNGSTWGTLGSSIQTSPYSAHFRANPPSCRVFNSGTQSIPDTGGGYTTVTFDSERWDTDSMHSTSVDTNRITINTAGLYVIEFVGQIPAGTDYVAAQCILRIDGATTNNVFGRLPTQFTNSQLIIATTWKLGMGQFIDIGVLQDNTGGTARNLSAHEFSATWVGIG